MKYFSKYILLGTFILSPVAVLADGNSPKGDVNGDKTVNKSDVTALVEHIVNNKSYTKAADIDGDGKVTIGDLAKLIDILLQLSEQQGLGYETDYGSGAAKTAK